MRSAEISLRQFLFICIVFALLVRPVSSKPTNRTIDDEYGDSVTGLIPLYQGGWNYGPHCSGCYIQPDTLLVFDRTWHDTTTHLADPVASVSLTFNGTAIWVYCIIPNFVDAVTVTTYVNLSFELDGDYVQTFSHEPELNNASMAYNVTVYSNTSMDNREHTLIMTPQHAVNASVVLFDWAQYTYDSGPDAESGSSSTSSTSGVGSGSSRPTPSTSINKLSSSSVTSPSSSTPVPVSSGTSDSSRTSVNARIAGGVGGGLGALVLGLLVLFLCHRRRGVAWARKMIHGNSHGRRLDESGPAAGKQRQHMGHDSVAGDGPISTPLHDAPSARAHVGPAELKRQIDALQMELDRLKMAEVNSSSP